MQAIKKLLARFVLSIATLLIVMPVGLVHAATTLNGHAVILDGTGKIIPWTANPGDGYGTVIDNAWNYLLNNVPNDASTGKPAYYSQSYLNPDTQAMAGWPHNPIGAYSMLTESALKYYAYSGNIAPVHLVETLASWQLSHGMSKTTDNWSSVPYSSGDAGSTTYQGASYGNSTGVGDGTGYLQPDKVGAMGFAWAQLYQFDGNTSYRDAAIAAADALASHVRTGNATQSPWPFRVNAATGAVREEYTANVIDPIQLFDSLIKLNIGNVASYQTARQTAWTWLMAYPMQNNTWSNYFEDVGVQSNLTNYNQLVPMMTARYLLQNPSTDANWQTHVQGLISWVESTFAVTDSGANTIKEQAAFAYPMGSHTSRYASVNALISQITNNATAKSKAYYSLNWSTYMARSNGVDIDGPAVNTEWFTDGYGDYIRHFLTAMQAFPEWAPSGQTHLTGSTSEVTNISYTAGGIQYTTVDPAATDSFRLNFTPGVITANGVALSQQANLNQDGWTYDSATGVLRVKHSTATAIQITSGATNNFPPTVTLSSPSNGSSYTTGTNVTLNASASDSDGTVAKVDFYNGTTLLGTSTTAPYSYTWTAVPAGSYTLTAVATDNSGAVTSSAGTTINVTSPSTLPAGWTDGDIGSVGVAGSSTFSNGTFTVKGSGVDIWDASDSFHFVSQPLNGDGTIIARVATEQNTDPWALAGIQIRESLSANAREITTAVTPSNGLATTWRSATGGASSYAAGGNGTAPYWLKLTRAGNVFTASKSTDGTTWTQMSQQTIAMTSSTYMGLAVTSHSNNTLATDTFSNVSATGVADTTPPVISSITTGSINQNGGIVNWNTNEASDSQIEYGLTASYGSSTSVNTSMVTAHSLVISGLDAGATYHYRVKSRDAAGNLATSADNTFVTPTPPDTTAPTQPSGLITSSVSSSQVELTWNASSDDTAVTGYKIYRNGTQVGTSSTTSYSDTTVAQQTTYSYTIAAYDAASNNSPQSASLSVTTPQFIDFIAPTAPSNLSATAVAGPTVTLNWTASTDNAGVSGYKIWRDGTQLTTTTSTTYSDAAVSAGETHSYYIIAYDDAANSSTASNTASVTIPTPDTTPPTAPTGLSATATTSTSVNLSWTASTDNVTVTGYRVYRGTTLVGSPTGLTFSDTGLTAGTTYSYTIKAIDAAGNLSAASSATPITTPTVTAVTIDKSVVMKQTTAATTIVAPSFSTTTANELLVAFIATDGGNSAQTISGVTGGGLTWTMKKRVNTQHGTSEIWTATATAITNNIVVTATHTGSYQGIMEVVAFQHAAIGTTGGANAATGAPTASLVTTAANSWVWGVGSDWDSATARTVGANQTKVDELLSSLGDTFWIQRQTATTPTLGTTVTINDTAPTTDRWNLATIEIIPQ